VSVFFFDMPPRWRCRWQISVGVLECANCSLHATLEGALSETVATISLLLSGLRVGKLTCGGGRAVSRPPTDLAVRSRSCRNQITLPKCGAVFSAQKDRRAHCKTLRWRRWLGGESLMVVTTLITHASGSCGVGFLPVNVCLSARYLKNCCS